MSYRISQGLFAYENMVLDLILLSVTAASMLYALYRYGKIYFAMIKEYNESLKRQLTLKINKFRQINIELFVKQLYNSYITMTANVQFGVLKGVCYALYKMRKTACGCFRFK